MITPEFTDREYRHWRDIKDALADAMMAINLGDVEWYDDSVLDLNHALWYAKSRELTRVTATSEYQNGVRFARVRYGDLTPQIT